MKAVFVGGRFHGMEISVADILVNGMWNGERSKDWSKERASGGLCPREELDNQPLVDGYLSPMWDDGGLRYETYDVYQALSR